MTAEVRLRPFFDGNCCVFRNSLVGVFNQPKHLIFSIIEAKGLPHHASSTVPQVILLDESDDESSGVNKDDEVQFLFSTETVPSVAYKAQRNLTDPNGNAKCDICSSLIPESQHADHSMAHQVTSRGVSMMHCAKKAKVDEIAAHGTGKVCALKHNTFALPNFIPKDKQAAFWANLDQNILQKLPCCNGPLDTPCIELCNSHKCQANAMTPIQLHLFDIGE